MTNEEKKEYARKWREENPEKIRESRERWKAKNAEKVKEHSRKWREKNREKVAEYNRRWKMENPEQYLLKRSEWEALNPDKLKASRVRARQTARVKRMQTGEWVRDQLMRLSWFKEPVEAPRYPRGIGNWAGDAVMRFDCEGLAMALRNQNTVMRVRRDVVEFYQTEACGRGDRPTDRLVLGWNGWISSPKALDKLAAMFGMEPGDYSDLDWSVPEYDSVKAVKNFLGHDLRRIRLGDKWRGWKIVDRELHEWLGRERLRLVAFAGDSGWGVELVNVADGKLFRNFVVEWGAGCEVARADLVRLVEWINERMAGIPLDEFAVDPTIAEVEAEEVNREVKKLLRR